MGYFEYFVYPQNQNISLEKLAIALTKNSDSIDLLCKTEAREYIYSDCVRIFGILREIEPVRIPEGTKGIVIGTSIHNFCDRLSVVEKLRFKPVCRCLDHIVLSCNGENQNKSYEDYFKDSPIVINGTIHFVKLNEEMSELEEIYGEKNTERKDTGTNRTLRERRERSL